MQTLSISIVGHTNTGKTSLMRTLLRDEYFGEIKNSAATTRHVESAILQSDNTELVKLYDTPGLEDASGILDWLENNTNNQLDGIERIEKLLADAVVQNEFAQEAKVLRQLLNSDAALYVIDAREPVLARYKDELTILSWCSKPIMPVFNFTLRQNLEAWQDMLARRHIHVISCFDTVAFDFNSEINLWRNLAIMLNQPLVLNQLIFMRQQEWQQLDIQAKELIAHFLIDITAYQQKIRTDEIDRLPEYQQQMQQAVRQLEKKLQQQLLQLYRFYHSQLEESDWVLQAFTPDPFSREQLKQYGIRTTTSAAAGALIGFSIDALTLGTSLGVATAIGGLIGGLASNLKTISNKIIGIERLSIDNATITLLAARALQLLTTLQNRGHASHNQIQLSEYTSPWQPEQFPRILNQARQYTNWSSLNNQQEHIAAQNRQGFISSLLPYLQLDKLETSAYISASNKNKLK